MTTDPAVDIIANTNGFAHAHDRELDPGISRHAVRPRVFATQMPNLSGSTAASAGYTCETSPSALARTRS